MYFIDKCKDKEEYESIKNMFLYGFVNNTSQTIKVG